LSIECVPSVCVLLQCTVRAIHPGGISVSISQRIHGFIPRLHLAEVLLKNPEKKFAPGKKLKCKVATESVGILWFCIACCCRIGKTFSYRYLHGFVCCTV